MFYALFYTYDAFYNKRRGKDGNGPMLSKFWKELILHLEFYTHQNCNSTVNESKDISKHVKPQNMYHAHFLRKLFEGGPPSKLACNHRKRKTPDSENKTSHERSNGKHRDNSKHLYSEAPGLLLGTRHRGHSEGCHRPMPHPIVQPFQPPKEYCKMCSTKRRA